ncbi:MAG TPA: cation transporter [Vicinamibacteria bacterium]
MPGLRRSAFLLPKMDCPAEESLVRSALDGAEDVRRLEFDLPGRSLVVWHAGEAGAVLARLARLGLGARPLETTEVDGASLPPSASGDGGQAGILWTVLAINAVMFVVEVVAGWIAESTGLLADGLDMLADALVYGVALLAVGRGPASKRRAARLCGGLQLVLGTAAVAEVLRRARFGSEPEPPLMLLVSLLALAANVTSLWLVARHRDGGVHMKATYICTTNDVLANLGVIAAAGLVAWTGSPVPDLVIGAAIAGLVLRGAVRILRL